jgi:hypothetical protein
VTNKALAGAARHVIRDYMDLVELHEKHLSLGSLVWAAAGKDDGLSPPFILNPKNRDEFEQKITKETKRTLFRLKPSPPTGEKIPETIAL